jgi:hypothetical protein
MCGTVITRTMLSIRAAKKARRIERILCKPNKHVIAEKGNLTSRPAWARAVVMGSLHA